MKKENEILVEPLRTLANMQDRALSFKEPGGWRVFLAWRLFGWILIFLLCLLGYTYVHTSTLLSRYVDPWWVGWVAGLGIEGMVVLITVRIALYKASMVQDWKMWFGLVFTLAVSGMANVMEGYYTSSGRELTVSQLTMLDPLQGITWLLATAMISLLVFITSEVVSLEARRESEERAKQRRAAQETKAQARKEQREEKESEEVAQLKAQLAPVERLAAIPIWPEAGKSVVYYIQGDLPNAIKIGTTRNLVQRARDFQVGIASPIVVAGWEYGEHEAEAHKAFSKQRMRGEWFALNDVLRAHISKVAELAVLEAQPEIVERAEEVQEQFRCEHCPATFLTKNALSAHSKAHKELKEHTNGTKTS